MTSYCRKDLFDVYRRIGVSRGISIYLTGNLGRLGFPLDAQGKQIRDKQIVARMHIEVIEDILGPDGTIVFPAHSWREVRSASIFDLMSTPCDYLLSQCLLESRTCRRQAHPFASLAATGQGADEIIPGGLSRHVYGPNTPMAYIAEMNALHVSIGMPVERTITAVHHCEQVAQVPYRYVKAFEKDIRFDGHVRCEEFYLHVLYRTLGLALERDHNSKIMALPSIAAARDHTVLGRSGVESVPLGIFVPETIAAMQRDPYIWLRGITGERPWSE